MNRYNIAVVGATGLVGEAMLALIAERNFPAENIYAIASERSAGSHVFCGDKHLTVKAIDEFDFSQVDFALFSAGGDVAREYAPKVAAAGATVVDNSSAFRYDDDIPLIVPEVNMDSINDYDDPKIIANPNCSTIQMLVALKPLYDAVGITRINVSTYQSVSGSGRKAIRELARQCGECLNGKPVTNEVYPQQIAFNVLPHIDSFEDNGYTREEMKMVWETQKIFNDKEIEVNPTAVRVPVFFGHSEAISIETNDKITAEKAREILANAPGVEVFDDSADQIYPTPLNQASGKDAVFVGRIRNDLAHDRGLNLWVVADNVRKGAALNALQIIESLISL